MQTHTHTHTRARAHTHTQTYAHTYTRDTLRQVVVLAVALVALERFWLAPTVARARETITIQCRQNGIALAKTSMQPTFL